jgi:hypothetical protein
MRQLTKAFLTAACSWMLHPGALAQSVKQIDALQFGDLQVLAEQGNMIARFELGTRYENGEGVPENDVEAVRWYRKAADQGYAAAQGSLGRMFGVGAGMPKSNIEAYKWFSLAAAQGNAGARTNKEIVARAMTPDQIAEAEQLAAQWRSNQ